MTSSLAQCLCNWCAHTGHLEVWLTQRLWFRRCGVRLQSDSRTFPRAFQTAVSQVMSSTARPQFLSLCWNGVRSSSCLVHIWSFSFAWPLELGKAHPPLSGPPVCSIFLKTHTFILQWPCRANNRSANKHSGYIWSEWHVLSHGKNSIDLWPVENAGHLFAEWIKLKQHNVYLSF